MTKNRFQNASWRLAASRWRVTRQPLTNLSETGSRHPRALALLVVLAGMLVPASPAFAVGTPVITTPATTPSYTTNQVDLAWSQVNDAALGYTVSRGTASDCSDAVPVFSTPLFTTTSYSETPADGSYCYFVTADDGAGTAVSATMRVFRDATDPAGAWTSPAAGAALTGSGSLDLSVTPSDATSGVASVAFAIESAPASGSYTPLGISTGAPFQQSWPYNLSTVEGTYHLHATVTDNAGNTTLLIRTVIVDNTGPTGDITVAAAVRGTVALPALASDGLDGTGVFTMQWFRNSAGPGSVQIGVGVFGTNSGSVNWDTTGVSDGLYQLSLHFLDNANNASTSVHVPDVLVDNTQPTGTLAPASNGAVAANATLVASVADAGSGVDQVTFSYSLAGINAFTTLGVDAVAPYQYAWDTTGVPEGDYDVRATVDDAVGNQRVITSSNVTVDRTAPGATLLAPVSGVNVRGAAVAVTPAVSDAGSGIARVITEYAPNSTGIYTTISDQVTGPYAGTWNTTSGVPDGLYSVRMRVFDAAGNSASATTTNVQVDNTAPAVTRTAPASNALLRGTVAFAGSASDGGSGLASDSFVLSQGGVDKATIPAISGSGNAVSAMLDTTLVATPDGLYDVRLEAQDNAGNSSSTSLIQVRIDNTAPTGSLTTAPLAGATVVGAVTLSSADAADTGGFALQSVSFEFAPTGTSAWSPVAAADTSAPYSVSWSTSALCDGTWDLRITVTDLAGNALSTVPITGVTTANGSCTAAITAPADSTVQHDAIAVTANAAAASGDSIANVTFAYRAGSSGSWITIGSPVTVAPYTVSFATTGVVDGLYDLRATVTTVGAKSGQSAPVTIRVDNNPPAAPTGFTATAKADGSVSLSWTAAIDAVGGSGVASYTVRRAAGSIAPVSSVDGDAVCTAVTATACSDANVLTGRTYTYAVFATDFAGKTSASATATVTPRDTEAPAAPAGLAATPGDGVVALSWQAAAADSDVTSYVLVAKAGRDVPVSENDGTRVCSAITSTSVACTATGLTNGTIYTFALFAFDEALNRSLPGTVSAAPNGTPPADTTPPSPVTALAAKVDGTTVSLSWKNPKDADFDHVVVSSSKAASIYQGGGHATSVEQPLGKLRSYKVVAFDTAGNASEAVTVKVTTDGSSTGGGTKFDGPLSPAHGERVLRKQVVLRWKKAKRASYYNIQVFDSHKKRVAIAWLHGTHWKIPGKKLKKGKKYTWYVWPGYGKLSKAKYGKRLGTATFKVK